VAVTQAVARSAGRDAVNGDPLDAERARLFALLGGVLLAAPDAATLERLSPLHGDATPLGGAIAGLAEAARGATAHGVEREYFALFIGVGRGELLPYASYYLTGFLHDRPLAALRADLARLGVTRAAGLAEPEDHIGFVCETFAGLLAGAFAAPLAEAPTFFARHLRPWAGRFFTDLERAQAARFYSAVGALGRIAIEIETAALDLPS
jgi:TorA maturation chaperone TorD